MDKQVSERVSKRMCRYQKGCAGINTIREQVSCLSPIPSVLKEKLWNSLLTLGQEGLYYIPPLLVLDPYLINGILMLGVDSVTS